MLPLKPSIALQFSFFFLQMRNIIKDVGFKRYKKIPPREYPKVMSKNKNTIKGGGRGKKRNNISKKQEKLHIYITRIFGYFWCLLSSTFTPIMR